MQLLKITTIPTKYELEIEPARLEQINDHIPSADVNTTPSELKIDTQNTSVRIDTYEARKSLGILNTSDMFRKQAELCKEHIQQKVREFVEEGAQMSQIEDSVTIPEIWRQKLNTSPDSVTVFIPSTGADLTWEPPKVDVQYKPSEIDIEWDKPESSLQYIPGSVRVKIVERGKVDIEYVGSPLYIPPSSDPNYEEKTEE